MRYFLLTALFCTMLHGEEQVCCPHAPQHMRAAVRHIEAGGVGYKNGYTTVEAFLATDPNDGSYMPFFDLRGHVFNDGKFSANTGLGVRTVWGSRVYGINGYYDYRNGKHKGYSQVSAGLETLGKLWDLRFNGYFPVGGKISHPYQRDFAGFSGHSLLVSRKFEYAMSGVDGELGFHFGKTCDFDFYAAAGSYYFTRSGMGKSAIGVKARLAAYYKEYVTLEVSNSYDAVFHDNVQGQLTLSLPFGCKTKSKYKDCQSSCNRASMLLASRMVQPVVKQEIVVLNKHKKKTATSDIFIFVNNESSSNGTFESPYPTLLLAQENSGPGNIIYVFTGDGTTTGMDAGIILQDSQKLWGSSVAHSLTTNLGTINIPPYTLTPPNITNGAGSGVTLASNNDLSGLSIVNATANGVTGTNPGNFSISDCILTLNSSNGLDLSFTDGSHNVIIGNLFVSQNIIGVNLNANTNSPSVNFSAENVAFIANGNPAVISGSDFSVVNATLTTNFFSNNTSPIRVRSNGFSTTPSTFSLMKSFIFATANEPLDILTSNSTPFEVTIIANAFTNCSKGIHIGFNNASSDILEFAENQISNTGAGDAFEVINASNTVATVANNAFSNNSGNAFAPNNTGGSLCLTMVANTSNAGNYALTNSAGTFNLAPCNVDSVNEGTITRSGAITAVESCASGTPCP